VPIAIWSYKHGPASLKRSEAGNDACPWRLKGCDLKRLRWTPAVETAQLSGAAAAKDLGILYSARDIEAEHHAAMASLSPAQRKAFARLALSECELEAQFALEAEARSFNPANDDLGY
jgi:hypothetical protein